MHVVLPASTFGEKGAVFYPLSQQVKLEAETSLGIHVKPVNLGKVAASCWGGAVVPGFSVPITCPLLLQWLGTITSLQQTPPQPAGCLNSIHISVFVGLHCQNQQACC